MLVKSPRLLQVKSSEKKSKEKGELEARKSVCESDSHWMIEKCTST